MPDQMRPTRDGACSYDDCPEYDGKRCSLTGCQPSRGCEPAYTALRDAAMQVITDRAQDRIEDPVGFAERKPYSRIHDAALDALAVACGARAPSPSPHPHADPGPGPAEE